LPLGAAIPLMFLIMLIPTVTDRATVVAATSGGLVAVLAAGLPSNIGLLVAAATGIVLGTVVAERQRTPLPEEAT
jgi:predicted branched-subunit amino acid permease